MTEKLYCPKCKGEVSNTNLPLAYMHDARWCKNCYANKLMQGRYYFAMDCLTEEQLKQCNHDNHIPIDYCTDCNTALVELNERSHSDDRSANPSNMKACGNHIPTPDEQLQAAMASSRSDLYHVPNMLGPLISTVKESLTVQTIEESSTGDPLNLTNEPLKLEKDNQKLIDKLYPEPLGAPEEEASKDVKKMFDKIKAKECEHDLELLKGEACDLRKVVKTEREEILVKIALQKGYEDYARAVRKGLIKDPREESKPQSQIAIEKVIEALNGFGKCYYDTYMKQGPGYKEAEHVMGSALLALASKLKELNKC